ncbi:hypothetical protein GOP47_0003656 [Adiantum capillus-veneris]|uniref:GTD-binding domain-containing protein n=1 Tax=Adiantum capillus-veneris TaxID=13818 RepID=A0A9D4V6C8_ADICA|nr:hypothetical protein GOP47_0003656 [Adiantum capillus-veneris]
MKDTQLTRPFLPLAQHKYVDCVYFCTFLRRADEGGADIARPFLHERAACLDEDHQDAQIRESSSGSLSYSTLDPIPSEKTSLHTYRCCCNKERSGGADEKEASTNTCSRFSILCCHHGLNSDKLSDNFMSKQEVLCFLNHELEQERTAAESAAKEAISMIVRLQAEKAALQMEARHYQELLEARALYNEATISQLKDVISSQEADRLILEREIDECKQALRIFANYMQDEDRQVGHLEGKDCCKISEATANAPTARQEKLGAVAKPQICKGHFRPILMKENYDSNSVHFVEGAEQMQSVPSGESKEEAKTKHVVSISSSSPVLNTSAEDIASGAYAMSHGTCSAMSDHQLRSLKSEVDKIWSLGLSKIGAHHAWDNYQGCGLNYKDGIRIDTGWESLAAPCLQDPFHTKKCRFLKRFLPQGLDGGENKLPMLLDSCLHVSGLRNVGKGEGISCASSKDCNELHQQEKAVLKHIDSWSEIMAMIDSCLVNLEERFAMFQSRLHALEVTKRAMVDAAILMNENKWKIQNIMLKASNMLKEFLFLTGLGCDILDILHELVICLTKASNLVEADAELDSPQSKIDKDNTLAASEEGCTLIQGDSPRSSSSTLSKLAFLWSSSLECLSNEKCRAETAFSGWDHV